MTDIEPQPEIDGDKEGEKLTLFDQPDGSDWFLAYLINLANDYNIEQGITLTVGSSLITGILISGRAYFEELGRFMRQSRKIQANSAADGLSILDTLTDAYTQFSQVYPKRELDEEHAVRQVTYIHLRRARIVTPEGKSMPTDSVLWRGKLSGVDGFILGELSVSDS